MFRIVRKSTLDDYEAAIHSLNGQIEDLMASSEDYVGKLFNAHLKIRNIEKALKVADEENARLWDLMNKRKKRDEVYRDKAGRLRNSNGQFARAK